MLWEDGSRHVAPRKVETIGAERGDFTAYTLRTASPFDNYWINGYLVDPPAKIFVNHIQAKVYYTGGATTTTTRGSGIANTAPIIQNFHVSQNTSTRLVSFSYEVKDREQRQIWVNILLSVPGERTYDLSLPEFKTSGISVSTATSVRPWFTTKSGWWDPTATTQFKDRYIPKVFFRLKVHDGEGGMTEVDSQPMTLNPRVLQQERIPPGLEKPKSPEETILDQVFVAFDKITKLQIEAAAKVIRNPDTVCFGKNLRLGLGNKEVTKLQYMLTQADAYSGPITGIFGPLTQQAVIRFQEKYQEEILAPYGLTNGTGFFGPATRVKLNTFFCAPSES